MMRCSGLLFTLLTVAFTCCDSQTMSAADPPATTVRADAPKPIDKSADKKAKTEFSESDLAATMAFASEHHPELARLLEHLRKSRSNEFQRAARELNQQIMALEKIKEKNPARHEHQLQLWKEDSQIRVLVAKWSLSKDEAIEKQIRQLLQQRRDTKVAQLKVEQRRLAEQLQKVEKQLTTLSEMPDSQIDREWEQLAKKTDTDRKHIKEKNSKKNNSN
jgi:DNA repair exonuclease SbcCD ATPase subunit